jgi:hypothetical protein
MLSNKLILKTSAWILLTTVIIFNACKISKTLDLKTADISKIDICDHFIIANTDDEFTVITNFIESQRNDWHNPSIGTYPTPRYTLLVYEGCCYAYSLYIGNNWLGASLNNKQYIKDVDNKVLNDFLKKIHIQ